MDTTTLAETERNEDSDKGKAKASAAGASGKDTAAVVGKDTSNPTTTELPAEVRGKLRRLDKLEARYHGMHCCFPNCDLAEED